MNPTQATHTTARTTPEAIRPAIQAKPDGPILLWYFDHIRSAQHRTCWEQVNDTCEGPGNGVLKLCGVLWKLVVRTGKSGGGFVLLERLTPEQTQKTLEQRLSKKDIKAWWQEQLIIRGYLEPSRLPITPTHPPNGTSDFEYDFAPEPDNDDK